MAKFSSKWEAWRKRHHDDAVGVARGAHRQTARMSLVGVAGRGSLGPRVGTLLATIASWYPEGKEIAYVHEDSLYIASSDGGADSRKIAGSTIPGGHILNPQWSPDGKRLVFEIGTDHEGSSLWEVSRDGKSLRRLLAGWSTPPSETFANWTPDGRYLLFQSQRQGIRGMWAIREAGSFLRNVSHEPVQLVSGPSTTFGPVPSTDGNKLFVDLTHPGSELVRYDSASHAFMPYLSGVVAMGIDYSPDGKRITYVSYPERTLWRSNLDDSHRLPLTFPPLQVIQPRRSPDGSRIAFQAQEPGKLFHVTWSQRMAAALSSPCQTIDRLTIQTGRRMEAPGFSVTIHSKNPLVRPWVSR